MEGIMKRVSILACILVVFSTASAQQPATKPPLGRHVPHRVANQPSKMPSVMLSRNFDAQARRDHEARIWELGTYPGGTWFASWRLNDLGVIVGRGDVPNSDGVLSNHTLAVPLFGPHAGEWIDLAPLGGEQPTGWEEPNNDISNTGLVVSSSVEQDGQVHGVAWTRRTAPVDLGTLADTGNPKYRNYKASSAIGTNKLGTLIVGNSGVGPTGAHPSVPVVWTPSTTWEGGRFVTKWKIHKLDTAAFPDLTGWTAWGVNNFGQIIGVGGNDDETVLMAALWTPRADGNGWERVMPLRPSPSVALRSTDPYGINDKGEIAGGVTSPDQSVWLSVVWKPLNSKRTKYSQAIVLSLPEGGFTNCENVGINDLGDMVGDCWNDDYSLDLPVHWTTKDPAFSEVLNFPGDWGFAWGVNNFRIATVTYGGGENCSPDKYGSCGGAIQLH
jgi:hypothetical protein